MKTPTTLTPELEVRCLCADPFEGDFGTNEPILSDKMVTAAKDHRACCHICGGDAAKGTRNRVRSEIVDGYLMTFRWCEPCCIAMAISQEDSGREWERRIDLNR